MCSVQASHDPDDRAMSRRSSRPRGTGELFTKANTWYGRWYVRGKPVKRSLGPVRQPGTRIGLTRTMAENEAARADDRNGQGAARLTATGRSPRSARAESRILPARAASRTRRCPTTRPISACTSRRSSATRRSTGSRFRTSRGSWTIVSTPSCARSAGSGRCRSRQSRSFTRICRGSSSSGFASTGAARTRARRSTSRPRRMPRTTPRSGS